MSQAKMRYMRQRDCDSVTPFCALILYTKLNLHVGGSWCLSYFYLGPAGMLIGIAHLGWVILIGEIAR